MLESFRKYTGLMFVILILLFVGLVFFGTGRQSIVSGPAVVKAHGQTFSEQDWNRFASNPARLARELAGNPLVNRASFGAIAPYLRRMGVIAYPGVQLDNQQILSFLVNRYTLQRGMREYGLHASNEAIVKFLRETIFVAPDGSFDSIRYDDFVKNRLPRLGMGEKEMYDLLGEVLVIDKLEDLVGSGIETSRDAVSAIYLNQRQQIDYQLASFPLEEFEVAQDPTEEEIETFWGENQGGYMSEPKRRLTYIMATPDFAQLEARKAAGQEEASPATEDDEDKPKTEPGLTDEERTAAVVALASEMDNFWDLLQEKEGEGFEELAAEYGFEVRTTELVTQEDLPEEFTTAIRGARDKTAASVVFAHNPGQNTWDATSDVHGLGDEQWFLFRIDEVVEPAELEFAAAKDKARLDLVRKLAHEEMVRSTEEMHQKLKDLTAGGKDLENAAEELGLKLEPKLSVTGTSSGPSRKEFEVASLVNPGEFSEVQTQLDEKLDVARAFFLHVDKREVVENPSMESQISQQTLQSTAQMRQMALDTWFEQQRMLAEVQPSPGLGL